VELNERNLRLQREMAAMQAAVPAGAGGALDAVDAAAEAAQARASEKAKTSWQQEARANYKALEGSKDEQIKNLKEQGTYFLKRKDEELQVRPGVIRRITHLPHNAVRPATLRSLHMKRGQGGSLTPPYTRLTVSVSVPLSFHMSSSHRHSVW